MQSHNRTRAGGKNRPPAPPRTATAIVRHYVALQKAYGRQHWWPARSRFEVILGAFLTQNTAWQNVELALRNLRRARGLSMDAIRHTPERKLARLIRPSGYFRQKAKRIKSFVRFLDAECHGSLEQLLAASPGTSIEKLRDRLLDLHGIGPETADSILLYAGNHPVFVVDAYTRRILSRHGLISANANYDEVQALVESAMAARPLPLAEEKNLGHGRSRMSRMKRGDLAQHYNEFHGLLVELGKEHCHKSQPDCAGCPLKRFLPKRERKELGLKQSARSQDMVTILNTRRVTRFDS